MAWNGLRGAKVFDGTGVGGACRRGRGVKPFNDKQNNRIKRNGIAKRFNKRRSAVCIGGVGKICKTTINFALNAME